MASLSTWLTDFRDLFFPRYCAVCDRRLITREQKLCGKCLMLLPYIEVRDLRDNPMARLFWAKIPIEKAHSYIHYRNDSSSHNLLMQLKYGHRPDLGLWLGRMMARDLMASGFFDDVDCLMPVPLHWRRQWSRGYNQSRQLARGIAKATGLPIADGYVRRVRNNPTQTNKSSSERIQNVKDLFLSRPDIPYRHLLLIDDVLTTGATLTAFAEAIQRQNPDVVFSILTLAKA